MKQLLLIYCIFMMYFPLNAQLKVDAGNDIIVCSGGDEAYKIGGCPVVSGGVEPYTYTWSGKRKRFPTSKYWKYASEILDDTTKSNPSFLWSAVPEDWFTFHLKVEDAEGSVGYDSVKIIRSYYISALIGPRHVVINRGDSVPLSFGHANFISNFMPLRYYFTPSYGLSDTTDYYNGWAKPDTTTFYYMYVINSVGCVSSKMGHLGVEVVDTISNSVQNISAINKYLQFFPNPAKNQITITNPSNLIIKKIELIDFSGRIVQMWNTTECAGNTLIIQHISPGVYLLKAETDAGFKTEKLVVH